MTNHRAPGIYNPSQHAAGAITEHATERISQNHPPAARRPGIRSARKFEAAMNHSAKESVSDADEEHKPGPVAGVCSRTKPRSTQERHQGTSGVTKGEGR